MNRRDTSLTMTALIIGAVVTGCGANPNAAPPGVALHASGSRANAPAAQKGGTCDLISRVSIKRALGGQVGSPTPDTLTPGLDRCSWPVLASALGAGTLIVFRPPASAARKPKTGPSGAFDERTLTLITASSGRPLGLQFVPTSNKAPAAQIARARLMTLTTTDIRIATLGAN